MRVWVRAALWAVWGDPNPLAALFSERRARRQAAAESHATEELSLRTYPHALVGWRIWQWDQNHHRLTSFVDTTPTQDAWEPRSEVFTAFCSDCENPPGHSCECGMYARGWRELPRCQRPAPGMVLGAVAARGRVEIHRAGFRAEEMQILALWPGRDVDPLKLARYNVPLVHSQTELRELARRVDPEVPLPRERGGLFGAVERGWFGFLEGARMCLVVPLALLVMFVAQLFALGWVAGAAFLRVAPAVLGIALVSGASSWVVWGCVAGATVSVFGWAYTLSLRARGRPAPVFLRVRERP